MSTPRKVTKVTVVTGALGVGKTTFLQHMLQSKPEGAQWAVLVNEFGKMGIDGALLAQSAERGASTSSPVARPIVIKELAGGCMCCTLAGPLGASIAQLLRQAKPDHLFIEPSGMGHPAGLLDVLQNQYLKPSLQLCAVICLVDVRSIRDPEWLANDTFQDQAHVADVLIGHKADAASAEQLDAFEEWAHELYPPKLQVLTAAHGRVDPRVIELTRNASFVPMFRPHPVELADLSSVEVLASGAPGFPDDSCSIISDCTEYVLLPRQPKRFESSSAAATGISSMAMISTANQPCTAALPPDAGSKSDERGQPSCTPSEIHSPTSLGGTRSAYTTSESPSPQPLPLQASLMQPARRRRQRQPHDPGNYMSCGWMFSPQDVFDKAALLQLLQALQPVTARVKGVFRVGKGYVVPALGSDGQLVLQPLAYRRESRLEVIIRQAEDVQGDQQRTSAASGDSSQEAKDAAVEAITSGQGMSLTQLLAVPDGATASSTSNNMQEAAVSARSAYEGIHGVVQQQASRLSLLDCGVVSADTSSRSGVDVKDEALRAVASAVQRGAWSVLEQYLLSFVLAS